MTMGTREHTWPPDGDRAGSDPFELKDISEFAGSMTSEAKAWLEAQKDYHALVASERVAKLGAGLLSGMVLCVLLGCVLLFLNLAGAIWIGRIMGDIALGFLLMGGTYLVLAAVFLMLWRGRYRDRFLLRTVNALYHG